MNEHRFYFFSIGCPFLFYCYIEIYSFRPFNLESVEKVSRAVKDDFVPSSNHEPVDGLGDEAAVEQEGFQTFPTSFIQPGSHFIQVPAGTQFIQPVQVPIQQIPVQPGFQQVLQPAAQFAQTAGQFAHVPQQFAQPSVQHFVQQPFQGHAQAFRQGSHPTASIKKILKVLLSESV